MTKRVALFTDFNFPDPSYSLNIVAEEQLGMLHGAGYKPVGIVEEGFSANRNWRHAELRFLPPVAGKNNHLNFFDGWETSVRKIEQALASVMEGVEIVITHDLIYQPALVWHNIACRRFAQKRPEIKWLHWIHSASPSDVQRSAREGLNQPFPNSKIVFPNEYSRPRIAINFNVHESDVAWVPHATDLSGFLGFQESTKRLIEDRKLLEADSILVYPVRLDRGKQVEYLIYTAAQLKKIGKTPRVVVVDFHSTGGDKVTYRDELKQIAIEQGLNEFELVFTSEFRDDWKAFVPRSVVRDLLLLANVFVLPSRSETYSLVAQEAALCRNLLVLNFDFPPMRDIYGNKALFYKFSSNIDAMTGQDGETTTKYADRTGYFREVAKRIAWELDNNFVLAQQARIRKERNPEFVFRKFIEPLFYSWDGT